MIQKTSIGLIGTGYLGKFHLQQIQKIQNFNLVGIHDINMNLATSLGKKYKVAVYESVDKLINKCDAVSIVVPTQFHYDIAIKALHKGCHIFIEKPITSTLQQAINIVELSKAENRICQIGHIERFNSAFVEFEKLKIQPKSIKCQRLNHYTNRGTDVSVVLDLMIHDIDLITAINYSEIKSIIASGEKKHSNTIDYAKADIVFNNGCQLAHSILTK